MSDQPGSEGRNPSHSAGSYTLAEILSQPQCWDKCLTELAFSGAVDEVRQLFGDLREWLFIGCGSSYYLALAAAASWSEVTGMRARAIPASELVLRPELTLAGTDRIAPVLISRSGRTSEVLKVAEFFRSKTVSTLAISCAPGQALEQLAAHTILLTAADEQSMAMTRSFTSMLLALQYLATGVAGNEEVAQALRELPAATERAVGNLPARMREFVSQNRFADYVCLGQGPYFGLACEVALKVNEMSCSYSQAFHTLEFRHGPKSIVSRETLIGFLLSQTSFQSEREVLEEIKGLGGTTLVVTNRADAQTRAGADFLVELQFELPELARLAPYIFAGQLMGLYTGLQKGLDPDHPRNLSRAVILKEDDKTEHAAI